MPLRTRRQPDRPAGRVSLGLRHPPPALPAAAQGTWPTRAVTIIAPFPPGGQADLASRPVAQALGEVLRQPVVVQNRAGAGGAIGTVAAIRAPADGYTLLLATLSHVTNPGLTAGKSTWHPADDFSGIVELVNAPVVALVPASLPVRTLKEFVE